MAAKQVRSPARSPAVRSLLALGVLAVACAELANAGGVSAFPSLFNRASLFRRHQQPQQLQQQQAQVQQQQQQQVQQQQQQAQQLMKPLQAEQQLVPLANSFSPAMSSGQLGALHPAELLRISGMHPQPQSIGAHPMHQSRSQPPPAQQQPFLEMSRLQDQQLQAQHSQPQTAQAAVAYDDEEPAPLLGLFDSAPQAAAYYKSSMVRPLASLGEARGQRQQQQQQAHMQQQSVAGEQSFEPSDSANYFRDDSAPSRPAGQPHSEPTHTSEIVDKIEQHVEHQIARGLKQEGEKLSSASEEPEEHGEAHGEPEAEEPAKSGEQEEEAGLKGGAEEKSKEAEQKEHKPEVHHHHHDHEHMQAPPEAFEVHHKKGGKSYQYFHQGHSKP